MSQLLRRVILRPIIQPRRMGGGHAVEYGPLNPKPGEQWIPHDRPQDDWYCYAAFVTIPTAFYYFCKHARDSPIGQKIVAWRLEKYQAREQRKWDAFKETMYAEQTRVMRHIEKKKLGGPREYKPVPDYENVYGKPVGVQRQGKGRDIDGFQ